MHWCSYNNAVSLSNTAKSQIFPLVYYLKSLNLVLCIYLLAYLPGKAPKQVFYLVKIKNCL